tara:strand:- start:260 stop:505 length:246 start_codon:yes stop_codon:yes gene_type:complete
MISRKSANIVSTAHIGNYTIPANKDRSYFFVVFTDTTGTVRFGQAGTGEIPLGIGGHLSPEVCPTGEIAIQNAGNYIVVLG